ncbi:hypothetical protein [Rahnella sikkimica]|uniref:Ead/Ea22-like family protein n=1 Tax=Rahnella sikkimica TaxID=1805933 RepID=A0A2L1UMT1_9GAMM|nr:hypothetical protein [Rahnella sikkimica]AVF34243.1 hypothetical protein BV494_04525 [Rahnella sikkimica]
MTDTTDIKALRDAAALIAHGYKQRWGCETNEDTGFVGVGTFDHEGDLCPFIEVSVSNWSDEDGDDEHLAEFLTLANPVAILALLDQLEAERQRADDAVAERNTSLKQGSAARNEFDKITAELAALKGDQVPVAVMDIQHGRADGNLFAVTLTKAGHALKDDVYELFTAPQKPVVLPRSHYVCGCAYRFMSAPEVIAAIEAAGGIVKDGE